ncbi:bi-domain-containing oxidoreductase [Geothrix sp. PMB-07]|uniref:bi-domain-containing oxidoreductase n=1 Tax=Geothrix sp. PMB-07 TaxID=3068640 RepID=UPI002741DFA0|nr:bi-domain-containing oxidoreductase [Geothrix sp. PMB-07]WLT31317.1 bi-domain-containing oxidoreductase [Geothrix sp. PMB-07]
MKQILQNLKTGSTDVVEVPTPAIKRGQLLVQTSQTLVSAGTERMLVEFGKAGWLKKAQQQPDKVRMVLDKIRTDGLKPTIEAVFNKLEQPLPLGYCNVGRIAQIAPDLSGFQVGERVISNGHHAEMVSVPVNLCAKVPDAVSDEEAAFTVLSAIALQGIRLVNPTLGEMVVVTGLGLIGLVTVQLLKANGCKVLGLDFDKDKLDLARQFGAEVVDLAAGQDPVAVAHDFSRGLGVDAVIVTAATRSSEPIHQAALMCRKRGRIVLVGVTGLELSRADFFQKELTFQVSCSYGPGRYDSNYEEKGNDYPVGFVRWTEQRNFQAVLDMLADGRLNVKPLISHQFAIEDAGKAYELIGGAEPSLGILLKYPGLEASADSKTIRLTNATRPSTPDVRERSASIGFLGAGNYATSVLMPAFKKSGTRLHTVASRTGAGGIHAGRKFGFEEVTTDVDRLFSVNEINSIVITTRHDSHASYVVRALKAGKHVFVEKPLCLTLHDLEEIGAVHAGSELTSKPVLMVGFNRRFAPQVQKIKHLLKGVSGPKALIMTVNAGAIPGDHWTQDPEAGGGRIVGEACHFIDLLRFLVGASIESWACSPMATTLRDTVTIQLAFADGSVGTIHYFANGSKAFPKERLEVFASGRILQLDNFRKLAGFGWPGFKSMNLWQQDKGQSACAAAFVAAVEGRQIEPIPFEEIMEVSRVCIELAGAAK